jgi:hypothetical protein
LPVLGQMDHEVAVAHCDILSWTQMECMKQCSSIWWVCIAFRSQLLAQILSYC